MSDDFEFPDHDDPEDQGRRRTFLLSAFMRATNGGVPSQSELLSRLETTVEQQKLRVHAEGVYEFDVGCLELMEPDEFGCVLECYVDKHCDTDRDIWETMMSLAQMMGLQLCGTVRDNSQDKRLWDEFALVGKYLSKYFVAKRLEPLYLVDINEHTLKEFLRVNYYTDGVFNKDAFEPYIRLFRDRQPMPDRDWDRD